MGNNSQDIDFLDEESQTDLTAHQLERVKTYTEAGMPGIASITDAKMHLMFDMYLNGKTYTQIARITHVEKDAILYLAKKMQWYATKQDYLRDMQESLERKLSETKVVSQSMLADIVNFYHVRIGKNIDKFLSTGETSAADAINPKDIDKYLKTVEILHKLSTEGKSAGGGKSPAVGLNLGDGVTVKKLNDNEVEITPKQRAIGDILKEFANLRRETENKGKPENSNDIKDKGKNEGERNEN